VLEASLAAARCAVEAWRHTANRWLRALADAYDGWLAQWRAARSHQVAFLDLK
jgi:hypothetical protein